MSIQANFPAIAPSLLLDFANTKQLDNRITFTRSTPAVYYDGKTTTMAEQNGIYPSTNLASTPQSSGATITNNPAGIAAPDGTITVSKFVASADSGFHYARAAGGLGPPTLNVPYTFSFYAKPAGFNFVSAQLAGGYGSGGGRSTITVDVSNGTIGGFTASQLIENLSSTATSVGNGWYRITITGSPTVQNSVPTMTGYIMGSSSTNISGATNGGECTPIFTGDGTNGVYVWGLQVQQGSTATAYTVTTTQPITNYIPVLLSAGGNQARFDCNPTTGESLGLLMEEGRTNIVTNSNVFTSGWTYQNMTVTGDTVVAPDGTLTADKAILTAVNNYHSLYQAITYASGSTYTYSIYAKAGELTQLVLSIDTGFNATGANAVFNLSTGVVTSSSAITTATITSVGNGWYRCAISAPCTGSGATLTYIVPTNSGGAPELGNAWNGLYLWGIQIEVGAFATSYIATTSASASRTTDVASMTGTNFSSWYNNAEWTLFTDVAFTNLIDGTVISIDDNSFNNIARVVAYENTLSVSTYSSNAFQYNVNSVNPTTKDVFYKTTFAAKANSYASVTNTNNISIQNSALLFNSSPFQMLIGKSFYGSLFTGRIKKIAYYPIRVSNTNVQALSS
jgi:hypothetical protein